MVTLRGSHVEGSLEVGADLVRALRWCEAVRQADVLPPEALEEAAPDRAAAGALRLESVSWVEQQVGCRLPEELLALVAVAHPVAAIATGLRGLAAIVDASEEEPFVLRAEGREQRWIRTSLVYSEPFAEAIEGAHGGAYRQLCISPDGPTVGVAEVLLLEDDAPVQRGSLGTVLEGIVSDELSSLGLRGKVEPVHRDLASWVVPAPRLVDDPHRAAKASSRRVHHPKFGAGTVVETHGTGPNAHVTVAFDEAGTRRLQARFLVEG